LNKDTLDAEIAAAQAEAEAAKVKEENEDKF